MFLDKFNVPAWYIYLSTYGPNFKDIILPLLLNRDKSKDPQGLTPLHIAYLHRNKKFHLEIGLMIPIEELIGKVV